jgi:hypothetical protein
VSSCTAKDCRENATGFPPFALLKNSRLFFLLMAAIRNMRSVALLSMRLHSFQTALLSGGENC